MSQHVSGSIAQSASYDFGEFISIPQVEPAGDIRIRKDLIVLYMKYERREAESTQYGVLITISVSSQNIFVSCKDPADADQVLQKLDWIFKKDQRA